MFCKQCGKKIPDNSQFCNYCGAKVNNICSNCGTELPEGSKFCHKCGTPFGENIQSFPIDNLRNSLPKKAGNKKSLNLEIEKTGYDHNQDGNELYYEGKYESAIEEYNEALRIVPFHALYTAGVVYLINRGNSFFKIGDRQNAVWDYVAAHQLYNYVFAYIDSWQNDVFCFQKDELKEICSQYIEWSDFFENIGREYTPNNSEGDE